MDKNALPARLLATFLEELDEHVGTLNREILALEKEPTKDGRSARLTTLLRAVHSLKGASHAVEVDLIEDGCHRMEAVLGELHDGGLELSHGLCALLFAVADGIEDIGKRLRLGQDMLGAPLAALFPQLDAASRGDTPAMQPARTTRAPAGPVPSGPAAIGPLPVAVAADPAVVRISAGRLDDLLANSGELLIAARRIEGRHADVTALRELVARWKNEWRGAERTVEHLTRGEAGLESIPWRATVALTGTAENLRRLERTLDRLLADMAADTRLLSHTAGRVAEDVRRVRMLPFDDACAGLARIVRDLADVGGKQVDLSIVGGGVELDRSVLEGLKDPLRHLIRNAVDHGVETPATRRSEGKPARARITVTAALRGPCVEVQVVDDGRGIDFAKVRARAIEVGLPEPADQDELARLVFEPGISTAPVLTGISGRGLGLDVVKSRLESLHGSVDVSSTPTRGTCFTMSVPLTLTTLRALLVGARGHVFAIPGGNVAQLIRLKRDDLHVVQGRKMLTVGQALLPVASLAETLGLADTDSEPSAPAVIVTAADKRAVLAVDELIAEQEVVVKSLGPRLRGLRAASGATVLASGRVALVLNVPHLVRAAASHRPARTVLGPRGTATPAQHKRVLVVDDSLTARSLEKSILEAAGYEVMVAADGEVAWRLLQEHGADLLVSDIEMPRMDGFSLTEVVRGSVRFRNLPVVLVTSRESEGDRSRGMQAGADAYLVKSAFDQKTLLDAVAQLV